MADYSQGKLNSHYLTLISLTNFAVQQREATCVLFVQSCSLELIGHQDNYSRKRGRVHLRRLAQFPGHLKNPILLFGIARISLLNAWLVSERPIAHLHN